MFDDGFQLQGSRGRQRSSSAKMPRRPPSQHEVVDQRSTYDRVHSPFPGTKGEKGAGRSRSQTVRPMGGPEGLEAALDVV
eukprot:7678149-Karenia_brevis.AAC.1